MENQQLIKQIIEAALMVAGQPLNLGQLAALFPAEEQPEKGDLRAALEALAEDCEPRGIEVSEVASGFRFQVKQDIYPHIARMWEEKPQRYSRALLETLALIAYRQPITRGEIEEVRGVSVSTNIIRTLEERDWIRVVGHRDVPGKPALYGTTREFLDYFNLRSLDQLPSLAELKDIDELEPELDFGDKIVAAGTKTDADAQAEGDGAQAGGEPDADTEAQGETAETTGAAGTEHSESDTDENTADADTSLEHDATESEAEMQDDGDSEAAEADTASQGQLLTDNADSDTLALNDDEELDGDDEHLAADLDAMLAQVDTVLHGNKPGTATAESPIPASTTSADTTGYSELAVEENGNESNDQSGVSAASQDISDELSGESLSDGPLSDDLLTGEPSSDSLTDDPFDESTAVDHSDSDELPGYDDAVDDLPVDDESDGYTATEDFDPDDIEADDTETGDTGGPDDDGADDYGEGHQLVHDPDSDTPRHG